MHGNKVIKVCSRTIFYSIRLPWLCLLDSVSRYNDIMGTKPYSSLWSLFFLAHCSVIQFFNKMKKWSDMANLPQQFRDKVDRLERNFAVSTVIFKKYKPIFLEIFRSTTDETPKVPRGRKQRLVNWINVPNFTDLWFSFLFHLKNHHSKDVKLKFQLKRSSHLDVQSKFVYCSCLYLTV